MLQKQFLLPLFVFLGLYGFAQDFEPEFTDKMALQEQQSFWLKSDFSESESYAFYDLVYQRMEWEINPDVRYIKGIVTSYFKSKAQSLTEIEMDLHSGLKVDSVIQNQQKINFQRNENKLVLSINKELQIGQLDSLQIFYQGEPPAGGVGFGAFEKNVHAGIPVIWTLSEPYGALEWWPCKQSLADKIDSIDVLVTCPDLFRTASNGILVSETVENGNRKMHWKHRFPIAAYLVAIAVTNYTSYSDSLRLEDGRYIDILNYVYPENLETAKTQTPVTAELIALYNRLIGEYPFASEKYGHAQFGWGGGMEHQTMSFMNNFSFGLIAHELAHQWFGDYITVGSWQDIWLNEGFATYLTGLSYENLQDGYWWPIWKSQIVKQVTSQPGGSVFVKDTTNIGTIFSGRLSYSKGSYILHMLRWVLGDEHFFTGMRNYFNDPEIANGFARNAQFVQHMETAGDTSLTEFFNDWYYGEGFPVYSAQFAPVKKGVLKINLSQTTSHNSVGFFEMPVPVRLYSFGKTDSADVRLVHTSTNQNFLVDVNFDVADIKIDPDNWLISKTAEIVKVPAVPALNGMAVYPNPFTDNFSVFLPSGQQLLSLRVFTTEGTLIKESTGNETNFYWPEIAAGVYFVQIKTGSGIFEQKILKL